MPDVFMFGLRNRKPFCRRVEQRSGGPQKAERRGSECSKDKRRTRSYEAPPRQETTVARATSLQQSLRHHPEPWEAGLRDTNGHEAAALSPVRSNNTKRRRLDCRRAPEE